MDLTRAVDAYCERVGAGLWAEPLNAVTNLAFLLAAALMWRAARGDGIGRALCITLVVIGVSSGLWHTLAVAWTGAADSLSILIFVLIYLYGANRHFLGMGRGKALTGLGLFFPYAALTGWVFAQVPGLGGSAVYAPVALLIGLYALALRHRAPRLARGLGIGAGLLCLSIAARAADAPLCPALPHGTHFLWHLLNAVMLAWMIHTYLQRPRLS